MASVSADNHPLTSKSDSHAEPLRYARGGRWLMLFGLPFLAGGVVFASSPLWGPLRTDQGTPLPNVAVVAMSVALGGLGLILMLGRSERILDRRAGTITAWWGLLVPFRTTVRPLGEFHQVLLAREVRRCQKSTVTIYPVRLVATRGGNITIEEPRDPHAARKLAEEIAKYTDMDLVDTTLGKPLIRQACEVDESLRQRVLRTGENLTIPPTPAANRIALHTHADVLTLELFPPGLTSAVKRRLALGVSAPAFAAMLFVAMMATIQTPTYILLTMGCVLLFFLGIPLLVVAASMIRGAQTATTIEITPDRFTVIQPGLLQESVTTIEIDALEEVEIIGAIRPAPTALHSFLYGLPRMIARSDQASVAFGEGLSADEMAWLKAMILNAVTA